MSDPSYRERTRVIHAGLPDAEKSAPFLPGPTFAAPFHLSGDPYEAEFVYGRYGNPTWTHYEQALGELEGGHAVLFASGMAAVSAVFLPRLRPGDVLVVPSDCYRGTRALAESHLKEQGIEVRQVPIADSELRRRLRGRPSRLAREPVEPGPRRGRSWGIDRARARRRSTGRGG